MVVGIVRGNAIGKGSVESHLKGEDLDLEKGEEEVDLALQEERKEEEAKIGLEKNLMKALRDGHVKKIEKGLYFL